jgi:hypothetical protein
VATHDPKLWRAVKALPAQRWVSLTEAFPRVKAAVGGSDDLAAHDLTMKLRAGKLTAAGRQIVRGADDRYFIFAREFWLRAEIDPPFRAAEALQRLETRLLPKGRGYWWFFFDRKQFDKHYPAAVPSAPKAPRADEAKPTRREEPRIYGLIRQAADKKWPDGWEHVGTGEIMKKVGIDAKRDVYLRALGRRKG